MIGLGYFGSANDGVAAVRVCDSLSAVDHRRRSVAGSELGTQATSRRVAALGRGGWGLPQWRARAGSAAEPRRSRAGVSLGKQRSDPDALLLHVRGYWPLRDTRCRRAPSASSVGDVVETFGRLWAGAGVRVRLWRPRHQNPVTR